jgi:putative ABC transport system permease protein
MFRNYIKTIFRQLLRNKSYAVINLIGLAVSMAACLLIAQFVFFHGSFDQHHKLAKQVYRVENKSGKIGLDLSQGVKQSGPFGPALVNDLPYVTDFTRLYSINYQNNSIIYEGSEDIRVFEEKSIYAADMGYFRMFDHQFLAGSPARFDEPNTIILTASSATRFTNDPATLIGQQLTISGNTNDEDYEVIGIIKDIPSNSHFDFSGLISFTTLDKMEIQYANWLNFTFYTYIRIPDHEDIPSVVDYIFELYDQNAREKLDAYGYNVADFLLVRLDQIHTQSELGEELALLVSKRTLIILTTVALVILIIAWINYFNLSFVKSLERQKELGIRKVMGAGVKDLTVLFGLESLMLNVLAFFISLTVLQFVAVPVSHLTGLVFDIQDNYTIVFCLLLIITIGSTLVGWYPVILIKAYRSTQAMLSNSASKKLGGGSVRSVLVTAQFIITFSLIAIAWVIYQQLDYMKYAELGFEKDNILVIKSPPGNMNDYANRTDIDHYNTFKTELLKQSGIIAVTNAGETPGETISWITNMRLQNANEASSVETRMISMGLDFVDFMGLEVIAGRNLREGDSPWSRGDVLINQQMAMMLGFDEPEQAVGAKLDGFFTQHPLIVRGVLENHHHTSLHEAFMPIMYILTTWTEYYFVKFSVPSGMDTSDRSSHYEQMIASVAAEWDEVFKTPMDYFFLDQFYNRQYAADEQFGRLFITFSSIAILIACLGLFGLISFTVQRRTKEIGIRKVLGADTINLILWMSRGYLVLILLAYLLAIPIAWYSLQEWLGQYAYTVPFNVGMVVIPLALVLFISLITISGRLFKAANTDPVNSLRYE